MYEPRKSVSPQLAVMLRDVDPVLEPGLPSLAAQHDPSDPSVMTTIQTVALVQRPWTTGPGDDLHVLLRPRSDLLGKLRS